MGEPRDCLDEILNRVPLLLKCNDFHKWRFYVNLKRLASQFCQHQYLYLHLDVV